MSTPTLTAEFPWLKQSPDDLAKGILGDPRPRSLKDLLRKKDKIWMELFKDWLQNYDTGMVAGLDIVTQTASEGAQQLRDSYAQFYRTAGDLKDAAKKDRSGYQRRFPWAPANVDDLLGQARPKTFDDLLEEGVNSSWAGVHRGWVGATRPELIEWLDRVWRFAPVVPGWSTTLDAVVAYFAQDVGRIKDRLAETYGSSGERRGERMRSAATEAAEKMKAALAEGAEWARDPVGRIPGTAPATTSATPPTTATQSPAPTKAAPATAAGATPTAAPATGGAGAGAGNATGSAAATTATGASGAAGAPAAAVKPARPGQPTPEVIEAVRYQLSLAGEIAASLSSFDGWVVYLAGRFEAFGGTLATEATFLHGFQQAYTADVAAVTEAVQLCNEVITGNGMTPRLFSTLREYRNCIAVLADRINYDYVRQYKDWPSGRIGAALAGLLDSESHDVGCLGGGALQSLSYDVKSTLDTATAALDTIGWVVTAEAPEGYPGGDRAQTWGTATTVAAVADLAAIIAQAAEFVAQGMAVEEESQEIKDAAAEKVFGMDYATLTQIAAQFR